MMSTQQHRPHLVEARTVGALDAVIAATGGAFDVDAYHVMDQRDDALIADDVLNGAMSAAFAYSFELQGKLVSNVSVIGARHLASHYRGLKFVLISEERKIGSRIKLRNFTGNGAPVETISIPELADEPDYYEIVGEITDIKTGNSIQGAKRETRFEFRRDGSQYERQHYDTIARSKLYRNLVLDVIPQDVRIRWLAEILKLGKGASVTEGVIDEKRAHVLRFATSQGIPIDRRAVERLTLDQIAGLGDAAREGQAPAFTRSAEALGLLLRGGTDDDGSSAGDGGPVPTPSPRRRGRPPRDAAPAGAPSPPVSEAGKPAPSAPATEQRDPAPPQGAGRRAPLFEV